MSRGQAAAALSTLCLLLVAAPSSFADTKTATNNAPIGFCLAQNASTFPSTIDVVGVNGTISNVTAQLAGYNTTSPAADVLLESPAGKTVMLVSDVPSALPVDLGIDDAAAGLIAGADPLAGIYKPTNIDPGIGDTFSVPGLTEPYGATMSALNGDSPNGTWKLYVAENPVVGLLCTSNGSIASWTLNIATQVADTIPPPPVVQPPSIVPPTTTPIPIDLPIQSPPPSSSPGATAAPVIDALTFSSAPIAGQESTLHVESSDTKSTITGLIVDFGERFGNWAESACQSAQANRGGSADFDVPYTYLNPGVHAIRITMLSGGCGKAQATQTTSSVTVAAPTAMRASAAQSVTTKCTGADATPARPQAKQVLATLLCLINEQRALFKLKPLKANSKLTKAALTHTRAMIRGSFFAHQGPREPSLEARLRKVRYPGSAGENIGAGGGELGSPLLMMNGWMHSKLHRANLLSKKWRSVGIAVLPQFPLKGEGRPSATYTSDFGAKP